MMGIISTILLIGDQSTTNNVQIRLKMKRLLFLFALALFLASCDKGETQLPDDKPKPPDKIIEVKDSIKLIDPA